MSAAPPQGRAEWLAERKRMAQVRYDTLFAQEYDRDYGTIGETHRRMLEEVLHRVQPLPALLDAPCGTGKYWPMLLAHGVRLTGIDQSEEMLRRARAKAPEVPVQRVSLQDLPYADEFDAVICVDGMENIAPEDWPVVLRRFAQALHPGGHLYLTVELLPENEVRAAYEDGQARGVPLVYGEDNRNGGYHYYPTLAQVRVWLAESGFETLDEVADDGDGYAHYLTHHPQF